MRTDMSLTIPIPLDRPRRMLLDGIALATAAELGVVTDERLVRATWTLQDVRALVWAGLHRIDRRVTHQQVVGWIREDNWLQFCEPILKSILRAARLPYTTPQEQ